MRLVLMDIETAEKGGVWPYQFNNPVYHGLSADGFYVVVTSEGYVRKIPSNTIKEIFIDSCVE